MNFFGTLRKTFTKNILNSAHLIKNQIELTAGTEQAVYEIHKMKQTPTKGK